MLTVPPELGARLNPRKSKTAAILLTGALAAVGTLGSVMVAQHYALPALSAASVPLPSAPPSATPAPVATPTPPADTAQAAAPQPAPPQPLPKQPYTPGPGPAPYPAPGAVAVQPAPSAQVPLLNSQQLDQLLAPVALYPDPLIAVMLPAASYPDELASSAQWLAYNRDPQGYAIDAQPWEPCIKALIRTPSVLVWMNNNPDWTRTVGTAFTYQPQDVMSAIQRLRAQAMAAGYLVNTPQQLVVYEGSNICLEPATSVIYVPVYDWNVVYVRPVFVPRDSITFFFGCNTGLWLDFDCDWDDWFITVGARWDLGWEHRWDHDRSARPVRVTVNNTTVVNNRTVVNNTTVNNTRVVSVGGTPWKRNEARPAPSYPASVARNARFDSRPVESGPPAARPAGPDVRRPSPPERSIDTPARRDAEPVAPRTIAPPARGGEESPGPRTFAPQPSGRGNDRATPAAPPPRPSGNRGEDRGDGGRGNGDRGGGRG